MATDDVGAPLVGPPRERLERGVEGPAVRRQAIAAGLVGVDEAGVGELVQAVAQDARGHALAALLQGDQLDARRFAAPCGIPSVARCEPSFRPGFDRWRTWRGPSWVNTAWLLVPAMRELGYCGEADRIVASLVRAVERYGFREYYNAVSGRGLAARGFGWSTLVVELV